MNSYSTVRHATGSFSPAHIRPSSPSGRRPGPCSGLGSSIRTPSSARARARSARPSSRAPARPHTSHGSPITVTESPAPVETVTTT